MNLFFGAQNQKSLYLEILGFLVNLSKLRFFVFGMSRDLLLHSYSLLCNMMFLLLEQVLDYNLRGAFINMQLDRFLRITCKITFMCFLY